MIDVCIFEGEWRLGIIAGRQRSRTTRGGELGPGAVRHGGPAGGFAGLVLPKLPAKVFPFLVLISPRPISVSFIVEIDNKKARRLNSVLLLIFFPAN